MSICYSAGMLICDSTSMSICNSSRISGILIYYILTFRSFSTGIIAINSMRCSTVISSGQISSLLISIIQSSSITIVICSGISIVIGSGISIVICSGISIVICSGISIVICSGISIVMSPSISICMSCSINIRYILCGGQVPCNNLRYRAVLIPYWIILILSSFKELSPYRELLFAPGSYSHFKKVKVCV